MSDDHNYFEFYDEESKCKLSFRKKQFWQLPLPVNVVVVVV